PEEGFATAVTPPVTTVPCLAGQRIAGIEQVDKRHLAEARHGEERRGLHLDHDTTLISTPGGADASLSVDAVRGPGLARDKGHVAFSQQARHCVHGCWLRLDLA